MGQKAWSLSSGGMEDLCDLLAGGFPKSRELTPYSGLLCDVGDWLSLIGVDDVEPIRVLDIELDEILRREWSKNGEMLAAGWLLRRRPEQSMAQAELDVGGADLGRLGKGRVELAVGNGNDTVFPHIAYFCLKVWTEDWRSKTLASPRSAFRGKMKDPTPRTRVVAAALAQEIKNHLERIASDKQLLAHHRLLWTQDGIATAEATAAVLDEASSRTVLARGETASLPVSGRPTRSTWNKVIAGSAVVVVASIGLLWGLPAVMTSGAGSVSSGSGLVEIESAGYAADTSSVEWKGAEFWLPADTPLDVLSAGRLDCQAPEIQQWLLERGQLRTSLIVTVRNLSGSDTLGVSNIKLQGMQSPPRPGFFVSCGSGIGGGGEVEFSFLNLLAEEDSTAVFAGRQPNFFWRAVQASQVIGLSVSLLGDQDFSGILTVEVTKGGDEPVTVPVLDSANPGKQLAVNFHAIPGEKLVTLSPSQGENAFSCVVGKTILDNCSRQDAEEAIRSAWGVS